ncbi:MAG: endonuclease/exonuclease/phosphatase family protein [Kofleriaceae bacterium]
MKWLFVAAVVCACSEPAPEPVIPRPGAIRFRFMTYNVDVSIPGDPAGIAAIEAASPDIVVLQEPDARWATALVLALGARFPYYRFEPTHSYWPSGGMGVMSRWPISHVDLVSDNGGPYFGVRAIIDAPGGPIQVLSLHLHPPVSDSGSWVIGYFSTRSLREREARQHVASLDPRLPTIVAGDFNEEDEGMAVAVFRARGFRDVLPRFQPNADTWQWERIGGLLRFRLDHILIDARFRAIAASIVDAGRSDHAPVWADLER